jgi:FkbM family methyltransferase
VRKIFAHVVQPGWIIFDVGANLGFYAAIAGRLVGPSGRVYAFEPSQRESQRAEKTLLANGLVNVELYRTAVGDADGEVCLTVCDADFAAYNSIGTVTHPEAVGHTSHQERVGCRALDSFVAEKQLRRVDLVKIDVEGAEELVLRGAQKLLSASDAPLVLSEIPTLTALGVGSSAKAVLDLLRQYGYIVYAIFDYGDTYELRRQPAEDSLMPGEVIAFKSCHAPFLRGIL